MRIFIVVICFCTVLFSTAQNVDSVEVVFLFTDTHTDSKIEDVSLKLKINGKVFHENFNYSGDNITIPSVNQVISVQLKARSLNYYEKDTLIQQTVSKNIFQKRKVLLIEIPLTFRGQFLTEFEVSSSYQPEIVFSSDSISVADFTIDKNGAMNLLVYDRKLNKGSSILRYEKEKVIDSFPVYGIAESLASDYRGNTYVVCEDAVFSLLNNNPYKTEVIDKSYFEDFIVPIVDSFEHKLFFTSYSEWYPAFDYYSVTTNDTIYNKIINIIDAEMMEHYRADYKWVDVRTKLWSWDMERETGIDREIWCGASTFTNSIYYEPPYAPMFLQDDLLYVMDHYKHNMYKIDAYEDQIIDSIPITYHTNRRRTGWQRNLLQDAITKEVYCLFDEAGYTTIKNINLENGTLNNPFKLHYRYVEKIQVYNNKVYYIYRPFESSQKKYLYSEELPLHKLKVNSKIESITNVEGRRP